jgi:hypothetical protein
LLNMTGVVGQLEPNLLESLIQEYGVNVSATRPAKLNSPLNKDTRVFEVEESGLNAYIIDTPMTRQVACHPHIVGQRLQELTRQAAQRSFQAILELSDIDTSSTDETIVFEQILRAGLGYQLHEVAAELIPSLFRTVYIRPRYTHTSYRDHDGVVQRQLNIVYEDFSDLPEGKSINLIMQDTVASSRSAEISLRAAIKHCDEVGSRIGKWIVYGFVSLKGLKLLDRIAQGHDIPLTAFAMGNLTALCANNYDMPLFGVDEWLWRGQGKISKLGAVVDRSTLAEYANEFIPGSDQPGDWSARQFKLYTGIGYEPGNISEHLENSVRLINSLLSIGTLTDWQQELARKELELLQQQLMKWKAKTDLTTG